MSIYVIPGVQQDVWVLGLSLSHKISSLHLRIWREDGTDTKFHWTDIDGIVLCMANSTNGKAAQGGVWGSASTR